MTPSKIADVAASHRVAKTRLSCNITCGVTGIQRSGLIQWSGTPPSPSGSSEGSRTQSCGPTRSWRHLGMDGSQALVTLPIVITCVVLLTSLDPAVPRDQDAQAHYHAPRDQKAPQVRATHHKICSHRRLQNKMLKQKTNKKHAQTCTNCKQAQQIANMLNK